MAFIADNDTEMDGGADLTPADVTPHSLEAEMALLGALLYDNEIYHRVSGIVQAKHFYNPVHIRIYDSISMLIEHGKLADAIVLKNRFSQDDTLVDIGGVEYLALLLENAPSGAAAPEYAKLIFDLALRRDLIRLGEEITKIAEDPDSELDAQKQISTAEMALFNLAEVGQTQTGFIGFDKALLKSVNMATAAFERDGGLSGISTGLLDLDRQLGGLHSSDLIILAGRPSMGKTSLATNIAFNVAKAFESQKDENGIEHTVNGGKVGFFSLEMSSEQLASRILSEAAEIESQKIRSGEMTEEEFRRFVEAAKSLENCPLYIDDTAALPISQLAARARRLKRTHGLDVLMVDYLQLVRPATAKDSRVNEVSEITQGLKAIAKELDIPVIALSQLSRQVESREDKRPQLSDLRESGSIEQDADCVMFVYRGEYYKEREKPAEHEAEKMMSWQAEMEELLGKAEVIIGKQRHGPIGSVDLAFEGRFTRFSDLAQPWHGSGRDEEF